MEAAEAWLLHQYSGVTLVVLVAAWCLLIPDTAPLLHPSHHQLYISVMRTHRKLRIYNKHYIMIII